MLHPILLSTSAKERFDKLVREAEIYHLIKQLETSKLGLPTRVLSSLGDILINTGLRLKTGGI